MIRAPAVAALAGVLVAAPTAATQGSPDVAARPVTDGRPLPAAAVPGLPPDDTTDAGAPVALDALLLGGGTVAYALAAPWIRPHFLDHFSLDRVRRNLSDPVRRLGVTEDDDGFFHNYVSHPVVWGGLGIVLRERGYGPWGALAMTQAHSVWWEYIVEGAWKPPSRVDMITNLASPVVTIFALHPLGEALWGDDGEDDEEASGPDGPGLRLRATPSGAGGTAVVVSVPLP